MKNSPEDLSFGVDFRTVDPATHVLNLHKQHECREKPDSNPN